MNILHMKYAVEVEKTSSITKAAENLYMGQPNLSRSIKELEEALGIKIFKRTSKGIVPTPQGEEFLAYAKSILAQIEEMESLYKPNAKNKISFSISVPRASYISAALVKTVSQFDREKEIEVNYKETNSVRAINNILQNNFNLGIIRFQTEYRPYFETMLESKGLKHELVLEYIPKAVVSRKSPLAAKTEITANDLEELIEICHGDPFVPSLPVADVKKAEFSDIGTKRIYVYERGSQIDLLREVPDTYMWVSGIPTSILECNGLKMNDVKGTESRTYSDILISKKNYRYSTVDKLFIQNLENVIKEIF